MIRQMKATVWSLAVVLSSSTAFGVANLDLTVRSGGLSTVTVKPGETVNYEISGQLTDMLNEGLALVGFDLAFDGGDLPATDNPTTAPMDNFMRPKGITNPDSRIDNPGDPCDPACGFGGTIVAGKLLQIGGGQNTIKNVASNAPFPIADTVITGLGHSELVLVTGSLTAPGTPGTYTLSIESVFANLITLGESNANAFLATEAAGVGTITNLTINVEANCANLTLTAPACDDSLWRTQGNVIRITFDGAITAPNPGDILIQELLPAGAFDATDLSAGFSYSVEGGNVLRIEETGSQLTHRTWITIRNTGGWSDACEFNVDYVVQAGDANNDKLVNFGDLTAINPSIPTVGAPDDSRFDINADGNINFGDLTSANGSNPSLAVAKPTGHACNP